jgi:putative DNA primase/helicase
MTRLDARVAARALGGEVVGPKILAPGPGHSAADRSLSIRLEPNAPDGFLVYSFSGDDWIACRKHVRARLGMGHGLRECKRPMARPRLARSKGDDARRDAFVREQIAKIVRELVPLSGTPGEQYLRKGRCIDTYAIADILARTEAIAWHPAVYFNQPDPSKPHHEFHGRRLGCIVARASDSITGVYTGAISRTYLNRDLNKIVKAKTLKTDDMPKGGVVRLSSDDETLAGFHLVEGLESGLALMAQGFRACWSIGSTWVMADFPVLSGIEALTIFADNDKNGAGLRSARAVEARWLAAGRDARIIVRDKFGDINDAVMDAGR